MIYKEQNTAMFNQTTPVILNPYGAPTFSEKVKHATTLNILCDVILWL